MRNEKDQSCLPAFIVSDGGLQAGAIQGVDLIITGSLYELDKVLLITDKIINVNTAEITAVAEKNIKNLDTVDSAVKEIVAELIIPATGKEKFTYSTETEGYSLMLGLNGVTGTSTSIFSTNPNPAGVGFTLGFISGRGKFWSGFSTSRDFTNDILDFGHASERILGTASIDLIFGDMVDNFAYDIGFGGGYDFSFGHMVKHPQSFSRISRKQMKKRILTILMILLTTTPNLSTQFR